MINNDLFDIYHLLSVSTANILSRKEAMSLRKPLLNNSLIKVAFDTRRINQETDYIPRRGLQNYHRSESFTSENIHQKMPAFKKLYSILEELKGKYAKSPDWNDSYVRVLSSAVQRGLRTTENDDDFSDAQPSMASFDYLEDLMYVRYRLTTDQIMSLSEEDIKKRLLSKDEILANGTQVINNFVKPSDISGSDNYHEMFNKMMGTMMMTTMANFMTNYKTSQDVNQNRFVKNEEEKEKTVTVTVKI